MKRKIYSKMVEWKRRSNGRTALLIDGARRVGKSYIAEEFGKREYAAYVVVDFSKVNTKLRRIFNLYLDDLDTFFVHFQQLTKSKLIAGDSLIIFDEVQKFPRAREAIKHLVADGRYHYIETGSLISINRNVKDILIPSEEEHLKMYPMDFEEFLWALGDETTMELVRQAFFSLSSMGEDEHQMTMDRFREYVVVGGMPQAVGEYVQTRDLDAVDRIKRNIISLYQSDIYKFAGVLKAKVRMIFNAIPSALSRHEKRIILSNVRAGARMRDFESTFDWLDSAMMVNLCYNASEPNVGLELNSDRTTLKCYMADTGLLVSMAFSENELAASRIHEQLITGELEINEGMIVENVVAQMLRSSGHLLFFYSKNESEDRMEIDFLLSRSKVERNGNILPIEVKSGKRCTTKSLNKYRARFSRYLGASYVLYTKDIRIKDDIVYLPLYMASLLGGEGAQQKGKDAL